jgi:hypothetical protein
VINEISETAIDLGLRGTCNADWEDYHITGSAGPNGPALSSSIADLVLIMNNDRIKNSIFKLGGRKLEDRMNQL